MYTQALQEAVRLFFSAAGVNLAVPPRSVFFNERAGILFVRASMEELDIVEAAIQALNVAPPQVTIETKFTEVNQEDNRALGFDWFLGNTLAKSGAIGMQGGTAPSYSGTPSPANPSGFFPGPGDATGLPGQFTPSAGTQGSRSTDNQLTTGLRQSVGTSLQNPALATITGILTDPQFRVVIRALEQRGGADLLAAPRVTTLSGRQAQVQLVDIASIVTAVDLTQQGAGGGFGGGGGAAAAGGAQAFGGVLGSAVNYIVQAQEFGPVLDILPSVSADGFSIQMTLIPAFTEFVGYDDPGQFVPQVQGAAGNTVGVPLTAQLPLPRFRVRQVTTSANVWDGQTVVLGGLISESVIKIKDKVPFLGDLPWFGRLFRSESSSSSKKNLVIFVTPTIIDPAGNPVHTPDNLPFDPKTIPTQTAAAATSPSTTPK
jgi:general secretion pathway protein D